MGRKLYRLFFYKPLNTPPAPLSRGDFFKKSMENWYKKPDFSEKIRFF